MGATFTVRDLLRPGSPLYGAEMLAAEEGLGNPVIWAVSLRPYAPAIPPMKGGEIALAAMDMLSRQGISPSSVVERLSQLGAAGFAIRGDADREVVEAAGRVALPLLRITGEAHLHDIEQDIIRECVLFQARREVAASQEPGAWIEDLVLGRGSSTGELQVQARRDGYVLPASLSVAYFTPQGKSKSGSDLNALLTRLTKYGGKQEQRVAACAYDGGVISILPTGADFDVLEHKGWACGIGTERPLSQAALSFEEARVALLVSVRLRDGAPARYDNLGADRLLVLLYMDKKEELQAFVQEILGPLLEHEARYHTHLLPTIESFAGHAGRLRETAGDIYVHRNTLAYRLDRAAEILDKDLKDPDTLLNIELALRAMRLLGMVDGS